MKIAVLTSSRADYSIYLPLLKLLQNDSFFDLNLIAFGTHTSQQFGYTFNNIIADGFKVAHTLDTTPNNFLPQDISHAMAKVMDGFANIWATEKYDLVFCLGDRYEMFAACAAGVPFNIKLAHIHGGEQTLGAIDEIFRHSLTHMSTYHFAAAETYKQRIIALKNSSDYVYNVGSLSFDTLHQTTLLTQQQFQEKFGIDISKPSILITYHPETVSYEHNEQYIDEFLAALQQIKNYQLIITMPNADTMGQMVRAKITTFAADKPQVKLVENFGTIGYLSCLKYCSFMLGNSSSGFAEAAFFPKYVINVGNRQQGRLMTENIVNSPIDSSKILACVHNFNNVNLPKQINTYGDGTAAQKIVAVLKNAYA